MNLLKKLRGTPVKPRQAKLQLEVLEARDVPTVVFNPQVQPQMVQGSNVGMESPKVNLIFSGSYWTDTAQGKIDENTMIASAQNIIGGKYLSGLKQDSIGSDGQATYGQSWEDSATLPSSPNTATMQSFLEGALNRHGINKEFQDERHASIYVVVSDPNSPAGNSGSWDAPGSYSNWQWGWFNQEKINMVHVGAKMVYGSIDKDAYTMALSQGLAEIMADPTAKDYSETPGVPPTSMNRVNQIAGTEAALAQYSYRLNGDLVQAYWSQKDNAFIVPDGNQQNFVLNPIWNGSNFTGHYNLNVTGDQLGANYSDSIRIDSAANNSRTQVTMNNESATFDSNIDNINIDARGGANMIQVAGTGYGCANVNVTNGTPSNTDWVIVGSDAGSLANIKSAVNVSNTSGTTALWVDASGDGSRDIAMTDSSVNVSGQNPITYTGSTDGAYGVTAVHINASQSYNSIHVDSKPAGTDFSVLANSWDYVYGDAAYLVNVIRR